MRAYMFFSDYFEVDPAVLEEYGALDISLINDLPLFIDPFLLYASEKEEYQRLHQGILDYLGFLKSNAAKAQQNIERMKHWFVFSEIRQNWLGYSMSGNAGRGLNLHFAKHISIVIQSLYNDLGQEQQTETSHVEELALFGKGIGKDSISDFTTNLIKSYLLEYTQAFAQKYIDKKYLRKFSVSRAYFCERTGRWEGRTYELPCYRGDFVLLTPKDMLTKDDTWMNNNDMLERFEDIRTSLPDSELRETIGRKYMELLAMYEPKKQSEKDAIKRKLFDEFPQLVEQYIWMREKNKEDALKQAANNVQEIEEIYNKQIQQWIAENADVLGAFMHPCATKQEAKERLLCFKQIIENNDGYKLLYYKDKKIAKEETLQLLFRFVWVGTSHSVDREVNNGRGPVDYKISSGVTDVTLVEFKVASNTKLKQNLANQVAIYQMANQTESALTAIVYFNEKEQKRVLKILKELQLEGNENIVLIDATQKESASNVK